MTVIGDMNPNHDNLRVRTWFQRSTKRCPVKGLIIDLVQDDGDLYLTLYRDNYSQYSAEEKMSLIRWIKDCQQDARMSGLLVGLWMQATAPSYSPLGVRKNA